MKSRKQCVICESPTARSIHFGARSCKACAAFFRRTIALGVTFECKESVPCTIHYEKRMSCKKCRFDKCIAFNMRPELVRSTRGAKAVSTTSDDDHMVMEHTEFPLPSQSVDDTRSLDSKRSLRSNDVPRIPATAFLEPPQTTMYANGALKHGDVECVEGVFSFCIEVPHRIKRVLRNRYPAFSGDCSECKFGIW
ncbi:zinc finger, C4 type, partial [Teladorsagia circumcincta]